MSTLFEFDPQKYHGSLRDGVSGALPDNTGVLLKQTEKGLAARFDGANSLHYGSVTASTSLHIVCAVKKTVDNSGIMAILTQFNDIQNKRKLLVADYQNILRIYFSDDGTNVGYWTSSSVIPYGWSFFDISFESGTVIVKKNNSLWAGTPTTIPATLYQYDTDVVVGNWLFPNDAFLTGAIANILLFNSICTVSQTEKLYQDFLRRTHISKPMVVNALTPVAQFDGATNYINCWNKPEFTSNDFSIFIRSNFNISDGVFISKYWGTSYQRAWQITITSGKIKIFTSADGIIAIDSGENNTDLRGASHDVGIKKEGTLISFFVDGVADGSGGAAETIFDNANHLTLAAQLKIDNTLSIGFSGFLSDFLFWDKAISPTFSNRYSAFLHLPLNESSGNIAYDSVGSNNGTYIGAQPHGQSHRDQIVSWQAEDQLRADGRTETAFLDGLEIESGSLQAFEDANGKSAKCISNCVFSIPCNLSEFVGHGYIEIGGSLTSESGKTVDAATGISCGNNCLSISLTAGQTFTGITVLPKAQHQISLPPTVQPQPITTRNEVWKLGRDAYSVAAQGGTITGATAENGVWSFDGDDTIQTIERLPSMDSISVGISFSLSTTGNQEIFNERISGTGYSSMLITIYNGSLIFLQGHEWETTISFSPLIDDTIHEYLFTNDGDTAYVYIDGVLAGYDASPATGKVSTTDPIRIGFTLVGDIGECTIYNRTFTAEEASLLHTNQLYSGLVQDGLVMYHDYTRLTAHDWSNHGNSGISTNVEFKHGVGAWFDGSYSQLDSGNSASLQNNNFTISMILNTTKITNNSLLSHNFSGYGDTGWYLIIVSGKVGFLVGSSGRAQIATYTHFGETVCVTIVKDGVAAQAYINNNPLGSSVSVNATVIYGSGNFLVGDRADAPNYVYSGAAKIVLAYNRAFTAAEIAQNTQYFRDRGMIK